MMNAPLIIPDKIELSFLSVLHLTAQYQARGVGVGGWLWGVVDWGPAI